MESRRNAKTAIALLVPLLATVGGLRAAPVIATIAYPAVPPSVPMVVTGSGFTGTTAATFLDRRGNVSLAFTVVSDAELRLVMPNLNRSVDHLLIESATGSVVTRLPGTEMRPALDFSGNGPISVEDGSNIVIKPGAVATSVHSFFAFIYVESGGVLQGVPSFADGFIIAEDGATLDFRGTDFSSVPTNPKVIHGASTTILGSLPAVAGSTRQVTSLGRRDALGPFAAAVRLEVTVVGPGSVHKTPEGPYVPKLGSATLTATPDPGSVFLGWTGDAVSEAPTVTVGALFFDLSVTATFGSGYALKTYTGGGGTVTADPAGNSYSPGQAVTLTAAADPGWEFLGWGADLSGNSGATAAITMNGNRTVTAIFRHTDHVQRPRITAVDYPSVPIGETMTFTGAGLADATAASFIHFDSETAAAVNSVSDTVAEVVFPDMFQPSRERIALIEAASGSTITVTERSRHGMLILSEFYGFGTEHGDALTPFVIIKAGAVAVGVSSFAQMVYVEAGAVVKDVPAYLPGCLLVAEDGATLDFSNSMFTGSPEPPNILYSPRTVIIGDPPTPGVGRIVRQIPSVSLSRGIGPFSEGFRLDVPVVGDGTVIRNPNREFFPALTSVALTAVPGGSAVFNGWSGAASGVSPTVQINFGPNQAVTATFSNSYLLETHAAGGTISREPDQEGFPAGSTVQLTATADPGFDFLGWGAELAGITEPSVPLSMNDNKLVTAIFRRSDHDSLPSVTAVDFPTLPPGDVMTFTGTGLEDTNAVTFQGLSYPAPAMIQTMAADELAVTFPEPFRSGLEQFVLIETDTGSTVTLADDPGFGTVVEHTGVGPVPGDFVGFVVVRPGAVATAYPSDVVFIHVEAGGMLRVPESGLRCSVFAEDGSILDFRYGGIPIPEQARVMYSPRTLVLGDLPVLPPAFATNIREVKPLSLSRGVGPFVDGCVLDITVVGPGSVTVDPVKPFYGRREIVQLTAMPDDGAFFVRWLGDLPGTQASISLLTIGDCRLTARFSDRPDFFSDWRTRYFSEEQLEDPSISGLSVDFDGDSFTNAAEYAFGTDPTKADAGNGIRVRPSEPGDDGAPVRMEYVRPANAADIGYVLLASDTLGVWQDGSSESLRFTVAEVGSEPLADDLERVTLAVSFEGTPPGALYFQLTANIGD